MNDSSSIFSVRGLRRLFGGGETLLERRVANLPVMVERRQGPRCEACGFGTLRLVPAGMPHAGMLNCDRPGCGHLEERPLEDVLKDGDRSRLS